MTATLLPPIGWSLWQETAPAPPPRPFLTGSLTADVAIIGAGYTGLWTAYYLREHLPSADVVVVEARSVGYGASGRNGGWCSAIFPASRERVAARSSPEAAVALQYALFDAVDEVGRVAAAEGIDCGYVKGGSLTLARTPAQRLRLQAALEAERAWGFGPEHYRWLDAEEAAEHVTASGTHGAVFTPHCAAVHPLRLVRGLAEAVERRGGRIFEYSPALRWDRGVVETPRGRIRAGTVLVCTEAYTARFRATHRRLVPLYSLMVATAPVPDEIWARIGWSRRETLTDGRHLLIYAQRTADGRIAFGGRGAPYRLGSRTSDRGVIRPEVFHALAAAVRDLFPPIAGVPLTHAWGGVLGAPRDWMPRVAFDPRTRLGWAGGYVGDGVAASHLAGRTLAELAAGVDSPRIRLPWVTNAEPPRWEPEPLRWLGINAGLLLTRLADVEERFTGRPSRIGRLVNAYLGH